MVAVEFLPEYALTTNPEHKCVRPVNQGMAMCGEPADYVSVRGDGWVSGTVWCAAHVAQDSELNVIDCNRFRWERLIK